jgi:predicted DNA-binding helix-hairpin-helix protein
MTAFISKPDTLKKLEILSADAQYDLACACGTLDDEHRKRGAQSRWIYPVTLPNGGNFPVDINKASREQLLRVPGLGEVTVDRILEQRKDSRIRRMHDVGRPTKLLQKANAYLCY